MRTTKCRICGKVFEHDTTRNVCIDCGIMYIPTGQ